MTNALRYIPAGSVKVADRKSDAVAYLYANANGNPCVRIFYGKQSKPVAAFRYGTTAEREKAIVRYFDARRTVAAYHASRKAERKAFVNPYKVGDVFKATWGYDQTNVDYYEAVAVKGQNVTVRKIAQKTIETQFMSGYTVPLPGSFVGEPLTKRANFYGVKIDSSRSAHFQVPKMVAGVPVYDPAYTSSYA